MSDLFFRTAFLGAAWADEVRISLAPDGSIQAVETGADARGAIRWEGVAVPGVPNLHSHAFQRAMAGLTERGSARGDTFWGWRERMYAFLARLTPEDVEAIAAQLHVELLRSGFTSIAEFHYLRNDLDGRPYDDPIEMGRRLMAAAEQSGIGITLLPTLYRASDLGGVEPTDAQRRFSTSVEDLVGDVMVLGAAADGPDVRTGLALHSLRAVPPADLSVAVEAVHEMDPTAPIHIHAAEQQREVDACLAWSGARPVEWLLENAPVDGRWCVVHATHMSHDEVTRLARSGAVAGLCPTTEANLGDGLFRLEDYTDAGGRWGVGTDSHVGTSPSAELRLLEYGQRLSTQRRNVAAGARDRSTGRALLEAALAGGTRACGRPVGAIEPGARADLVVLDDDHPTLVGRDGDTLLDAWIFAAHETPVRDVMVGGKWVVRDGRHCREGGIADRFREVARRLAR